MNTVDDIRKAIEGLSPRERLDLTRWLRQAAGDAEGDRVAEPAAAYKATAQSGMLTVEEYLELEGNTEIRYEYVAGAIFAMSGATVRHNLIVSNISNAVHNHLRGGPCRAFSTDMKVRLEPNGDDVFYYPDVLVVCGKLDLEGKYVQDPKLVVEVLSPSTERTDWLEKALNYRQIASLEEYALVAQRKREVTICRRREDWKPIVLSCAEATVNLQSIDLSLPLAQIYEGVSD